MLTKRQRKTYTLSEKAVKILEDLAKKTKLKMSTIVEAGILEMERVYNEKNNINFQCDSIVYRNI